MIIKLTGNTPNALYQQFLYPAGEMQVRLTPEGIKQIKEENEVFLVSKIKSASDIIEVLLLNDAITYVNPNIMVHLILPYLPYSRADRRFVEGDCFGLNVFGTIIDYFHSIITLDVHSYLKAKNAIYNLMNVIPDKFIIQSLEHFANLHESNKINILFPDEGAKQRYILPKFLIEQKNILINKYHCNKKRDPETGKLLEFEVPELENNPTIIIDDICDGGGTFLGIAEKVSKNISLSLYVTHGIFSKGLNQLFKKFQVIYTTDSFIPSISTEKLHVYECLPYIIESFKNF